MKKLLTAIFIIFAIFIVNYNVLASGTITQEQADSHNTISYPKSVYNGGINSASQKQSEDVSVDPASGNVHMSVTDISLPGKNGFDLNITRTYNSSNANLYEPGVIEKISNECVDRYKVYGQKSVTRILYDGTIDTDYYDDVCLTPDFLTLFSTRDAAWMIKNASVYEYSETDSVSASKLFTSESDAAALVAQLQTEDNNYKIETTDYIYDGVLKYTVKYYNFTVETISVTESISEFSEGVISSTASDKYSGLGAGWEFDFPYVEVRYAALGNDEKYLHFGEKGVYRIDFVNGGDNNLDGYDLNDIKIVQDTSYTSNVGVKSQYRVDEKDGTKHYFGIDGRLLLQEDCFGNQIQFTHDTIEYTTTWGGKKSYPRISQIKDSVGREVYFAYDPPWGDSKIINIWITGDGDDVSYTYEFERLTGKELVEDGALCDMEFVLSSVTDPSGNSYVYDYTFGDAKFNFLYSNGAFYDDNHSKRSSATGNSFVTENNIFQFRGEENIYALLESSQKTNERSYYFEYSPFVKKFSSGGSMIFYKAYSSWEKDVSDYGNESILNLKNHEYDLFKVGEYDGYQGYETADYNNYGYTTVVYDGNVDDEKESYDIYTYKYIVDGDNKSILLSYVANYGTDHDVITEYSYDVATKLLTEIETKEYSKQNSNVYMIVSTAYTYDSGKYGDVLTQTLNSLNDRTITYTYDPTYHFPLSKTYKMDADTVIREEYVPTSEGDNAGKSIEFINVYENDVLKKKTQYAYDDSGNIINEKRYINDTDFTETQYTYQDGAYVSSKTVKNVQNNDGTVKDITTCATYDYYGNPITQTDANGNIYTYSYDIVNRITKVVNPDSTTKRYSYSSWHVKETDELGTKIETMHTASGNIKQVIYGNAGEVFVDKYYTPFDKLEIEIYYSAELDEADYQKIIQKVQYEYDTFKRPVSKEIYDKNDVLVYKETYSYEVFDTYIKQTTTVHGSENNPSVVTSEYIDAFGHVVKRETGSDCETYTYDYVGNVTSIKSAKTNAESGSESYSLEYDFNGNVTKETNELGISTRAEYDPLGRLIKSYDPDGYVTEYKYDSLDRLIEQKTPFEEKNGTVYYSIKKIRYDDNGNVIEESINTNASGDVQTYSTVEYGYDSRNRLVTTKRYDGETYNYIQHYYDPKGNLLRTYTGLNEPLAISGLDNVTENGDGEYAVIKYTYDSLGSLTQTTDSLGNTEHNTYESVSGLLLSSTDRNGRTFNYSYDGLGNLVSKSLDDETNGQVYVYGLTGKLLSQTNDVSTISYVYDNKGRLVSENDSAAGTVKTYTYDSNGNRLTFSLTRNGVVEISQSYTYDKINRLTSVSENGSVIASYSYDNKNNRTQTSINGGETTSYTYNLANLLTSQVTGNSLYEEYEYYLNGNQRQKNSNGAITNYYYDSMNRLKSENSVHYSFDDFGNRSEKLDYETGIRTIYSYDLNNRLKESIEKHNNRNRITRYYYDPNGNNVSKAVIENVKTNSYLHEDFGISNSCDECVTFYEYNCYNQLEKAETNGVISSYTYAPNGLRHSKTVGGNTITFVYDNANVVEEITADGTNKYYRGIEIIKNDDNLYYLYNGQGDVAFLIDAAGAAVADYVFDAYGNQSEENTIYNPFGYRGEYTDAESGLIYLRARMYDPQTGRFINEDPVRDGLNWYVYCNNNPVNYIDPNGLYYLEKDEEGQVYAVIESGDTLSNISYSEVRDAHAYLDLNYAEPGFLVVGQRVNITGIYNENYPVPTNIMLSKTRHTQGDSGLKDVSDEEISRRARDRNLSGEERRRYQREEKLRGQRNKQKRQSNYSVHSQLPYPNTLFSSASSQSVSSQSAPSQSDSKVNISDSQFWEKVGAGVIAAVGVCYFCYSGDPSMIYQYAR